MTEAVLNLVAITTANHTQEELAMGYIRYEMVRRLNPKSFGDIWKLNISGQRFDDIIEDALELWAKEKEGQ